MEQVRKASKDTEDFSNDINQHDLIYKSLHTIAEYTFFQVHMEHLWK